MTPNPRTNQLYDMQKKALRLICKPYQRSKKTLSNAWVTQKTHVLPVPLLSTYFACNFAFSIKSCKCSSYISKYFWTICSNKKTAPGNPVPTTTTSPTITWWPASTHSHLTCAAPHPPASKQNSNIIFLIKYSLTLPRYDFTSFYFGYDNQPVTIFL